MAASVMLFVDEGLADLMVTPDLPGPLVKKFVRGTDNDAFDAAVEYVGELATKVGRSIRINARRAGVASKVTVRPSKPDVRG